MFVISGIIALLLGMKDDLEVLLSLLQTFLRLILKPRVVATIKNFFFM